MADDNTVVKAKMICLSRCLNALGLSIVMQNVLLLMFLFVVGFNILHPIDWLAGSVSLILSSSTWLRSIPLGIAILLYGILLARLYLLEKKFYKTRFIMIWKTFVHTSIFFNLHVIIGYLTVWTLLGFIGTDKVITSLTNKCSAGHCINEKYVFLLFGGIFTGIHFYCKSYCGKWEHRNELHQVVYQNKFIQLREKIYQTISSSFPKMLMPTLGFVVGYSIIGFYFARRLAAYLSVSGYSEEPVYLFDFNLNFYLLLVNAYIYILLELMRIFCWILLSEPKVFSIERSSDFDNITLAEALTLSRIPMIQTLAAFDLTRVPCESSKKRITEVLSISNRGGHPHNWKAISEACIGEISKFRDDLKRVLETNNVIQKTNNVLGLTRPLVPGVTSRLLKREYNFNTGIRELVYPYPSPEHLKPDEVKCKEQQYEMKALKNIAAMKLRVLKNMFFDLWGVHFLFAESSEAELSFVLERCQQIGWLVDGISTVACLSINEDRYGVVQTNLTDILRTLIDLKLLLDQLGTLSLLGDKINTNFTALQSTLRRCLYRLSMVFSDYVPDFFNDPQYAPVFLSYS